MPVIQAQQAHDEILANIKNQGGAYSTWYCGITGDINARLFGSHKLTRDDPWWSYRECPDETSARNVEKALIALGCDGGAGGGDASTKFVYAYLKSAKSDP